MKRLVLLLSCAMMLTPAMLFGTVIVDDSWADGGRNNGPDPLDTDWWISTSSGAIEVSTGSMGLVTGGSGRGIHGTFTPQTLNVGDSLTATFSFITPPTVGNNISTGFRVGLFDTLGRSGLAADISASSGSPNPIYNGLPGYMMDFDVNTGSAANITFREHDQTATAGQLLATTTPYIYMAAGGDPYSFAPNTSYTGVISVTRSGADTLDLTGSLYQGATLLSTYTTTDSSGIASTFGLLAFQANSGTFGSSNTANTPYNGIDFSNIKIETSIVPEPSSAAMVLGGLLALGLSLWRRARA
jgi:hypothetical protein